MTEETKTEKVAAEDLRVGDIITVNGQRVEVAPQSGDTPDGILIITSAGELEVSPTTKIKREIREES